MAGVSMAILFIFLQLGLYRAMYNSSVLAYDQFTNEITLVSHQYSFLLDAGQLKRARVFQALSVPGVAQAIPLYYQSGKWRNVSTGVKRELGVMGINPGFRPFKSETTNDLLARLSELDTAAVDLKTDPTFENFEAGTRTEVQGQRIEVLGEYRHGAPFVAGATMMVSDATYSRIFNDHSLDDVTVGLIWLQPNADRDKVKADLEAVLPNDVQVWTRDYLFQHEQRYLMQDRPVGIVFTTGLWLAFVVGAVILYQVLSADIVNHIREYATLKAIGYKMSQVYAVILQQAILFTFFGFLPALIVATGLFQMLNIVTPLPMQMTPGIMLTVFALSATLCSLSGMLAVRKVKRANPADLF